MFRFPFSSFKRSAFIAFAGCVAFSAQMVSAQTRFQCEGTFAGDTVTSIDKVLLENAHLFSTTRNFLMKVQTPIGNRVKVRIGHFGASSETFEDVIDLTKAQVVGVQSRETRWPDEGSSLEIHIREPSTMNDVWKVPLASELDGVAFLTATKFKLPIQLREDHLANGFIVSAGAQTGARKEWPVDFVLKQSESVVGVTAVRTRDRQDSILILRIKNSDSGAVSEFQLSRTKALKFAHQILR